jgi:hypothetical protein
MFTDCTRSTMEGVQCVHVGHIALTTYDRSPQIDDKPYNPCVEICVQVHQLHASLESTTTFVTKRNRISILNNQSQAKLWHYLNGRPSSTRNYIRRHDYDYK